MIRSDLILLTLLLQGCAYGSELTDLPEPTASRPLDPLAGPQAPIDDQAVFTVVHSAGRCSGFAIDTRTMITAAHCVGSDLTVTLIVDGLIRYARPVDVDHDRDRAWLMLTDPMPDFSAWLPVIRAPKQGETARLPKANNGSGTLQGAVYYVTETDAYIGLPGIGGDSGSPLIGADGAVIGVAWRVAGSGIIAARLD